MKNKKIDLFPLYNQFSAYEKIRSNDKFISYDKLISSVLFSSQNGYDSAVLEKFNSAFTIYQNDKIQLIFKSFILGYEINNFYAIDKLVPSINTSEKSQIASINLAINEEEKYNNFLTIYNKYILELINNGLFVEIFHGLIIYVSDQTNNIKVLFSKDYVSQLNIQ
ncbi:MSC_0623 family F1-like ATPase-associated protein [Mycoplasmopsis opalescens]|uniref:MSC_0623 family F1-like ATPase-associated protein n=1 Tax=Mycoplasmopsis opalescens TaxID=114886 RepID=UPI0004A6A892|nr:DUF2714 domain-containing protein [Mycoplasmopsis opalescens]